MDRGILKLVFVFSVKNNAVIFDETDDGSLPSRTLKEGNQAIEDPILRERSIITKKQ